MTETTFEDVYSEVKKVNRRLDSMEKTLRALMTMLLPEEEISEEEWREITAIDEEMVKGECTTRARVRQRAFGERGGMPFKTLLSILRSIE